MPLHQATWWGWLQGCGGPGGRGLRTHLGGGQEGALLEGLPLKRAQFSDEDWVRLGAAFYKYSMFTAQHTRAAQK